MAEADPQLAPGRAVTVNPLTCAENSVWQARGLAQLCPSRRLLGAHRPGAYAEFVAVPARAVHILPAGLSLRQGALTEPTACGVRIGELAGDLSGVDGLVIGAGPIGLLALQALKRNGARHVFVADLVPERLAMAGELGAVTLDPRTVDVVETVKASGDGDGVPLAVDAVGTAMTRAQCIAATRPAGTVILSGLHQEVSEMPVADVIRREITLKGSFAYTPANFSAAVELLEQDAFRLDPWIVEAPLGDGGPWFERLIEAPGNVAKVLLIP